MKSLIRRPIQSFNSNHNVHYHNNLKMSTVSMKTISAIFKERKFYTTEIKEQNELRGRRVLFNVPGSEERKVQKATTLDADVIVFDLEDGVSPNKKKEARTLLKQKISQLPARYCRTQDIGEQSKNNLDTIFRLENYIERLIRVNDVNSEYFLRDMEDCVLPVLHRLDGILIPKVNSSDDLLIFSEIVDSFNKNNKIIGDNDKPISIFAAIESARGIVNLNNICNTKLPSSCALSALIYASEDLCADMGITRTDNRMELMYTRQSLLCHAKAYQLDAIDLVCIDYKDTEKLYRETLEGVDMGFDGKQAIHPNQISTIYDAYRPPSSKIEFAKKIVNGYSDYVKIGKGAFEVDGKMIDLPMVKWAKKVLKFTQ